MMKNQHQDKLCTVHSLMRNSLQHIPHIYRYTMTKYKKHIFPLVPSMIFNLEIMIHQPLVQGVQEFSLCDHHVRLPQSPELRTQDTFSNPFQLDIDLIENQSP